jgi:tRNA uridine 5-carboxymethylaminomethyl modification enzyme
MEYDVLVVGAGHAGCEAACSGADGGTTLLRTRFDLIAQMPCNPAGGPGKASCAKIDALAAKWPGHRPTFIQPTNQAGARLYIAGAGGQAVLLAMKHALETTPNLYVKQALVEGLLVQGDRVQGVFVHTGQKIRSRTVVLTTGTFLAGKVLSGEQSWPAGRAGEFSAVGLASSLRALGFPLVRLQTNTPPRVDARTIDFSLTTPQPGSDVPLHFSLADDHGPLPAFVCTPPNPTYPVEQAIAWRPQLPAAPSYLEQTGVAQQPASLAHCARGHHHIRHAIARGSKRSCALL